MSGRRKLSPDEKSKLHAALLKQERAKNPGANVAIKLSDELSDDGKFVYTISVTRTAIVDRMPDA